MVVTVIQADAGLFLRSWAAPNPERLARLFREAWQRFPMSQRLELQEHWEATCPPGMRLHPGLWPSVELAVSWPGRERHRHVVHNERLEALRFWQPVVEIMPDRIVTTLITDLLVGVNCCQQDGDYTEYYRRIFPLCGLDLNELEDWREEHWDHLDALEDAFEHLALTRLSFDPDADSWFPSPYAHSLVHVC